MLDPDVRGDDSFSALQNADSTYGQSFQAGEIITLEAHKGEIRFTHNKKAHGAACSSKYFDKPGTRVYLMLFEGADVELLPYN